MFFKKKQDLNADHKKQLANIDARIKEGEEILGFVQKGITALKESRIMLEKTKEYAPII